MPRWLPGTFLGLTALALAGCDVFTTAQPPPRDEPEPPAALGERFDPGQCGTITGQVTWEAPIPSYPPIVVGVPRPEGGMLHKQYPNPNALQVDPITHAIRGAVVFLEDMDPARSRAWDQPPVGIEIHDEQIHVVQGKFSRQVGIVRRGEEIEMVSRDPALHVLTGRGAAFFALTFPDPDQSLRRRLSRSGLVELTNGAGRHWQQAYLFVSEHPYYTVTDAAGRFALRQVPAGSYRLTCWLPNGKIERKDLDPNMGHVIRHHYAAPWQWRREIMVAAGAETSIDFPLVTK